MSDISANGSNQGNLVRWGFWLIVNNKEWKMRQPTNSPGEKIGKDIKRTNRKQHSSEKRSGSSSTVVSGEDSIAELCRREDLSQCIYYKLSKD